MDELEKRIEEIVPQSKVSEKSQSCFKAYILLTSGKVNYEREKPQIAKQLMIKELTSYREER
jgi:hypothetical protein